MDYKCLYSRVILFGFSTERWLKAENKNFHLLTIISFLSLGQLKFLHLYGAVKDLICIQMTKVWVIRTFETWSIFWKNGWNWVGNDEKDYEHGYEKIQAWAELGQAQPEKVYSLAKSELDFTIS